MADLKNNCRLVARGNKVGRMFTLDVKIPTAHYNALYTQKNAVIVDTDIWHKQIGHVNLQGLKSMQSKNVVIGLLNFKSIDMQKVCEACQFGK